MQKGQAQEMATNEKRKRQQMKFLVQIEIEIDQYYLDRETNLLDFLNVAECSWMLWFYIFEYSEGEKGTKKKYIENIEFICKLLWIEFVWSKNIIQPVYTMCRKHFIIAI